MRDRGILVNIVNFVLEGTDDGFQLFIRGHLYLEALLSEIIDRAYPNPSALANVSAMFYRKVKLLRAIDRITEEEEDLLLAINKVRNRLAHKFNHQLTFDAVYELALKANAAKIEFSDDTIYLNKEKSEDWYGIYGVISEVICNTFYELLWNNEDLFTKDDIGDLLG